MLKKYPKNIIQRIIEDDFPGMAAEMAFMFVIGIFPFLLFLMAFFGWLGKKSFIEEVLYFLYVIAPPQVTNLFETVLQDVLIFKQGWIMATIGIIITIALTSNAIAVVIKGLNRAYGKRFDSRNFILTRLLSVLMVIVNALVLFLSINLIIFGKIILEIIATFINVSPEVTNLILILRWPLSFLVLYVVSYMNYYLLPDIPDDNCIKQKSVGWGALFFCIFWLLGSWGFSIYVGNLDTYNRVYGTIGAFAMLMVWLYYTSLIILIGGEINSQVYKNLNSKEKNIK